MAGEDSEVSHAVHAHAAQNVFVVFLHDYLVRTAGDVVLFVALVEADLVGARSFGNEFNREVLGQVFAVDVCY